MSNTSEHPEVQWALDILTPDEFHEPNIISKHIFELFGTITGVSTAITFNWFNKRPLLATLQRHIVLGVIGGGLGVFVTRIVAHRRSVRDAVMRDYIIRHPEDFPAPVRKKWSEVFETWRPVR